MNLNLNTTTELNNCNYNQILDNCINQFNEKLVLYFILLFVYSLITFIIYKKNKKEYIKDLLIYRIFLDFVLLTTFITISIQ
jgi:hypothetical protein